ncbi:cytochrome P450 6k1-like [Belonocnema kinseyi]|uniref:cytochrome P450 6k1-like n=1 Tax=Belonocnema kinseyi TaxID=2817044 RepID=UPI00143D2C1D|nr:cytochrome P450 6k1-like [Belonocnema kinseyi]
MLSLLSWFFPNALVVFAFIFISIYFYIQHNLSYWKRKGVPSPPTHWLFGNFKDAILGRMSAGNLLGKLHKEAGDEPFIGLYVMHKPFFLMRDPELVKQVFVKDFQVFQNRYFAAVKSKDLIASTGLFSINNPEWKYLRMKLSPVFSSGKQKKLFSLMIESSENMRKFLGDQLNENEKVQNVDAYIVSIRYITDVISSLAYGVRTNSFGQDQEFFNRSREPFKKSLIASIVLFVIFFFPVISNFIVLFHTNILGSSTNYFRNLFWDVMNQRERSGNKRGDSIDPLLEIKHERDKLDFDIPDDTLLAQPVIFSIAGTESSSITIAQTLVELAKNPVLQDQVRKNIKEELKEHGFTYEGIKEMKLLYQAISETLRLYPPAPIIDRVALQDYKIPGTDIVVEKGTAVYAALNGLHEDPRFYKEPLKYDPDRFSEERKGDITPCAYIPFGIGPRACIGERVGMLQTAVGLATILRDYEVALNPLYKNGLDPKAIFIEPLDGVKIDFKKISK